MSHGFEPILASDGCALRLLRKEYPDLISIELPAYNIRYPKNGRFFKLKLLSDAPKLFKAIEAEKQAIELIIEKHDICGIISDNRWGIFSKKVPSVYITHQLNVLSGSTTWLSTKMHQKFIKKFDVCWIPDYENDINLSGKLGHANTFVFSKTYIGPLSRFKKKNAPIKNDILVLLSGPEPQRTLLEKKLFLELKDYNGTVVFVKGIVGKKQTKQVVENITIYNFMTSDLLEKTINVSSLIIARSGYTTIMDLAKLNKKAFLIPTPGQFEQEYLAKRLTNLNLVPSCKQNEFSISKLENINNFKGLKPIDCEVDFKALFSLFERK